MSTETEEKSTATSKSMISNLMESELDLGVFEISSTDKDDQEEEAMVQDKNEEESDDEEEDEPENEDEIQVKVTQKNQVDEKNFGRDKNGMFNNHQNYMKLRNKINEQENSHSEMFDTINKKLTDHTFIQQAIELSADTEQKIGSKTQTKVKGANLVSSQSEAGMSDADVKCYEAKFPDLEGKTGREHFLEYGQDEERWPYCAQNLTNEMAQRYLDLNPDLQHSYGRGSPNARTMARNQYTDYGYAQTNRTIVQPSWDETWFCGFTGENKFVECGCHGTLHYGYYQVPSENSTVGDIDTFEKMRDWKNYQVKTNGWTDCNDATFGLGNYEQQLQNTHTQTKYSMQCYCEPEKSYTPTLCAQDGGDCLCNGVVFYMKNIGSPAKSYDFYAGMSGNPYTLQQANNTKSIKCGKSSFEDVNPLPGDDKQCWCDEQSQIMTVAQQYQIKEYWRVQLEAVRIREAKLALEEERKMEHMRLIEEENLKQEQLQIKIAAQKAAKKKLKEEMAAEVADQEAAAKELRQKAKANRAKLAQEAKKKEKEAKQKHKKAEKRKKKAQEAKAAALKNEHEEEKNRLLEEAEKEENAAIAEALKASQDEAAAAHATDVADLQEKQEEARKKAEIEGKAAKAKSDAEADEAAKAAEVAEAEEDIARKDAEDKARAEHAKALELKYEQEMEDALEKQKEKIAQRYAAEEALQKKKDDERLAKEAEVEENRKKAQDAADKDKAAAEAEAARVAAEEEASAAALKKAEEFATSEKHRLEQAEHDQNIKTAKAKDAVLAAQKAEQIATSEGAIAEAQKAERAASLQLAEDQADKKRILDDKNRIKDDVAKAKKRLATAKANKANAKSWADQADASKKKWVAKAAEEKAKAVAAAKAAQEQYQQHTATMRAIVEANEKAHLETVKNKENAFKAQQQMMRDAHDAAERARKNKEAAAIAKSKHLMMERRKEFEKRFKHVWTTGPVGVNKFYVTSPTQAIGEALLASLFDKTIIADVKQQNVNIRRDYLMDTEDDEHVFGHFKHAEHQHRMSGVTNDDRIAELIEECSRHSGLGVKKIPFDIIITPLITGSPDYIEWIKLQTMKVDKRILAHYNIDPEAEIKGLNNYIDDMAYVHDEEHAHSTVTVGFDHDDDDHSHVQLKAENMEKSKFAEGEEDENSTAEKEADEQEEDDDKEDK